MGQQPFNVVELVGLASQLWRSAIKRGAVVGDCVGFCGGRIVALAWCPTEDCVAQYVLVSLSLDHGNTLKPGAGLGFLQLWVLRPSAWDTVPKEDTADASRLPLEILWVMEHNFGLVADVKWCPSGIFEEPLAETCLPRLGCFAAATSVGQVVLYCVPRHFDARKLHADGLEKVCPFFPAGRIVPCVTLTTGTSSRVLSIDWCPMNRHEKIAAGLETGYVLIWSLVHARNWNEGETISPDLVRFANLAPVQRLSWYTDTVLYAFTLNGDVIEMDTETGELLRSVSFVNMDSIFVSPLFPGFHVSAMLLRPTTSIYPSFVPSGSHPTGIRCAKHKDSVCSMALLPSKMCILCADHAGRLCSFRVRLILPGRKTSKMLTGNDCEVVFDTEVKHTGEKAILNAEGQKCGHIGLLFHFEEKSPSALMCKSRKYKLNLAKYDYLAGLFSVACSINKNAAADWVCFGGESGYLHFMDLGWLTSKSSNKGAPSRPGTAT